MSNTRCIPNFTLPLLTFLSFTQGLAAAAENTIEEIVVTADFRARSELDLATSVTVMTEAVIKSRSAQHFEELANAIPNVNYASGSNRARFFQIRGIGERSQFVAPINPSVGFLVDNVDFSGAATIATMLDVEQVEVLRGPQGTRYGANALAGLINVKTRDPQDQFAASLKLGAADYNTETISAMVTGPLTDTVSGRLAVGSHRSDGYYENSFLQTKKNNEQDEVSIRGKLSAEMSASWKVDLSLSHVDIDNGYDAFTLDNSRTTLSDEPGRDRQESLALAIDSSWELDSFDLKLIVGLADSDMEYSYDEDWTFAGIHPDGYMSRDSYVRDRETQSLELRFLSNESSRLFSDSTDWLFGVYTLNSAESLSREYTFLASDFRSDYDFNTAAAFFQLDSSLSEKLTLETGLRVERRDTTYKDSELLGFSPAETLWGGRIAAKYLLNSNTMAYASIARGYKAGGFNTDGSLDADLREFGEEFLIEYELGMKSSLLEDKLHLKAALFHDDRHEQQVKSSTGRIRANGSTEFVDFIGNAAEGTNNGVEFEAIWYPSAQLGITASLGLLDATFDSFINSENQDLSGRDQAHAPGYMAHLAADYNLGAWSLSVSLDAKDDFYFSDSHSVQSEPYELLNMNLSYSSERWSLSFWGRNLTDQDYAVRGFFFGEFGNDPRKGYAPEPYLQFGEPRVIGVSFEVQL
ncbi:MAG: TonB-dependent receptor [SAR86 cluster bacterium]|uniref:TonB-dependent receptor n=1 Tax=SAR86 cluster bacterium TaxID=2030880 RepID=A0A2A4X976_9GAMM|nr:MAG: TonB-dependent receptor [SAR86 cluster bacterium]